VIERISPPIPPIELLAFDKAKKATHTFKPASGTIRGFNSSL